MLTINFPTPSLKIKLCGLEKPPFGQKNTR